MIVLTKKSVDNVVWTKIYLEKQQDRRGNWISKYT